jgi:peptide/nickel transport system substrate-binding protein
MQFRLLKLKFRRRVRKGQRQVEDFSQQAETQIEAQFFDRFSRLRAVRRFMTAWVLFFVLLIGLTIWQLNSLGTYYQSVKPVPGGIYTEGILGDFTNANPVFASGDVDGAISKLIFASLFQYNNHNQLVGDLAQNWSANELGTIYTVNLKPGLTWQDGQPLTADDVAFTYQVIQNPDAQSPLESSWRGITVTAVTPLQLRFTLPNALSSFPYEMTNGIIPKHILGKVAMTDMRSTAFNTVDPIGAGPFAWKTLQVTGDTPTNREEQIALSPFAHYNGGMPKLDSFVIHAFHDQNRLITSYQKSELTAISGLTSVPTALAKDKDSQKNSFALTAAKMVFFKNTNPNLSDPKVRQALVASVNVPAIIQNLGYATRPVTEPLLVGQLGYQPGLAQFTYDPSGAATKLDAAGWVVGKGGIRYKGTQPLTFTLYGEDDPEDTQVARTLVADWRKLGVKVDTVLQDGPDLQQTVSSHSYDALLHGISIGVDPDVFVYWDSSQADIRAANRLNLSEYKSSIADAALEGGRTRQDPGLRVIKYKPFLEAWQQDAPALGLYQPRYLYITRQTVYNLDPRTINSSTDRFNNVENWELHQAEVTND